MNNNMNIDENMVNKLKEMMNNGDLNDVISQIPPELIQNFSNNSNNHSSNSNGNSSNNNFSNNFDLNNIDINTMLKMKSIMEKMNSGNNSGANLLQSLKPYLRDERKNKVDQYANLLNMSKLAELFKSDNTENKQNE